MADSSINPSQLAQQMATAYTQSAQGLLNTQTQNAQSTSSALTKLQSALQAFQSALSGLSGKTSLLQQSATFSNAGIGTASANGSAQPGSYSFFVEQVASANQVSFQGLTSVTAAGAGTLGVNLADGSSFGVDLAAADLDGDNQTSPAELARAINQAGSNAGKVSASVLTVNGQTQLLLTAGGTGATSQITLDTSAVSDANLKAALNAPQQLVAAQDAIVWLGAQNSGVKMQQASNTFSAIQGVSLNFTQAMAAGAAPVTLSVATDSSGTAANLQSFVDAYNALEKTLDTLTDTGDASKGTSAAAFASDAGVRSLRSHLSALLRQSFNGQTLFSFGVSADRDGNLSLDQSKLTKALAANPAGLDQLFGGSTSSGLLGTSKTYLGSWLSFAGGQIKQRQDSVQRLQKDLSTRQSTLTNRYNQAYDRYLAQFSRLQTLQEQMSQTSGILSNLTSS